MKIIFLSYINRSGSSFLAELLSRYEDVFVFPEGDALIDDFLISNSNIKSYQNYLIELFKNNNKLQNWNISKDSLITITNKYNSKKEIFINILLNFKNQLKPNANILIFKKRDAFIKYNRLKNLLEMQLGIISIIRDPRAIFSSQKNTIDIYSNKPFNINPIITAYYWNFYLKNIKQINNNIIIKYEDLIIKQDDIINSVLNKINSRKTFSENNIFYIDIISSLEKKMHYNISKQPIKSFINKWEDKLKYYEILIINKICNYNIINEGYSLTNFKQKHNLNYYVMYIYFKIRIFFKIDVY